MTMHNVDRDPSLCEQAQELLPAYALGVADEGERAIVEAGLTACPELQTELSQYEDLSEAMLYAVPQVAPPPQLGIRLMERVAAAAPKPAVTPKAAPAPKPAPAVQPPVTTQPSWWQRNTRPIIAVAAASLILLLVSNLFLLSQTITLKDELFALTPVGPVLNFSDSADVSRISLTRSTDQQTGTLAWSRGTAEHTWIAWLSVDQLPTLTEGTYQLWLGREGETPYSAGVFDVSADGHGVLIFVSAEPLGAFDFAGITAEPVGGSAVPTTDPVLEGTFQPNA